ncbi:MAG: octaprenyl diphosphate synthase [Candidatus Dadabacteria bacterium]|nr:octaprenyl diphosphate synthase [Candidatus Dadabacteria bacterium]NIQ14377.1 octaprenyl diphosphate synthase [Candidatus Dadabacteria bacterium]
MELTEILNVISAELEEVESELEKNIQSPIPLVYEISKYLLGSGGKRLRPSVLLLSSGACGLYDGIKRIYAAASLELIHTATLLHDDVVDEATLRRGKTSSNVVWGNKPTVLVGDFMLARALSLLQSCGNLELIKFVTDASAKLAEGQVLEVMSGKNMVDVTEDICFSIIDSKTASLIESCGKVGALLADSNSEAVESLGSYGRNIGIAFQLVDDALDYVSTEKEFGKAVGQDLIEGKMTLPLFYSLENAPRDIKNEIKDYLRKDEFSESNIYKIREVVEKFKGVQTTNNVAKEYIANAKKSIQILPDNIFKKSLNELADYVVERTF